MPDVGRQLAGDARPVADGLDVLIEVLVDAVDENGQGRLDEPPEGKCGTLVALSSLAVVFVEGLS